MTGKNKQFEVKGGSWTMPMLPFYYILYVDVIKLVV